MSEEDQEFIKDLLDASLEGSIQGGTTGLFGARAAGTGWLGRNSSVALASSNLTRMQNAGMGIKSIGKAGKFLGPVGTAITVGLTANDAASGFASGQDLDAVEAIGLGAGALGGAAIGAGIGVWFFGVGAVPGAAIGAVVGTAGAFIGKLVAGEIGSAAGVENKYRSVQKYTAIEKDIKKRYKEANNGEEISGADLSKAMTAQIALLRDAGIGVKIGGGWFGLVETYMVEDYYHHMNRSSTLEGLQQNLATVANRRDGLAESGLEQFADDRAAGYERILNRQIDSLAREGKLEGMAREDGTIMTNDEAAEYLKSYTAQLNDKNTNMTRAEAFNGAVLSLEGQKLTGMVISDAKAVDLFIADNVIRMTNAGQEIPDDFESRVRKGMNEENLNAVKLKLIAQAAFEGKTIAFENPPTQVEQELGEEVASAMVTVDPGSQNQTPTEFSIDDIEEEIRQSSRADSAALNAAQRDARQETFLGSIINMVSGLISSLATAFGGLFGGGSNEQETNNSSLASSVVGRDSVSERSSTRTASLTAAERDLAEQLGGTISSADSEGRGMERDDEALAAGVGSGREVGGTR